MNAMKNVLRAVVGCGFALLTVAANAGAFKLYPGAQLDEYASAAANRRLVATGQPVARTTIYATVDDYDKVFTFYRKQGRVFNLPKELGTATKLPEGKKLRQSYVILDGATTLAKAKRWVKVQSPYAGPTWKAELKPGEAPLKELTAILYSETP
ncbi:MAG: hypothetical protein WBP72_08455 [Rhodocyclaceae bacterium]